MMITFMTNDIDDVTLATKSCSNSKRVISNILLSTIACQHTEKLIVQSIIVKCNLTKH